MGNSKKDDSLPYAVGKIGETPMARFSLECLAEEYIDLVLEKKDPQGVANGDYYLDGPSDD